MKFKIGDIVRRQAGTGFVLDAGGLAYIPDNEENKDPEPCIICEQVDCVEWPTLWALDNSCAYYHVAECQLEKVDTMKDCCD